MMSSIFKSAVALIVLVSLSRGQTALHKISDISLAPVSTFKDYCSRCHGEEGKEYGKNFGSLPDDSLRIVTEDMMYGPGGLTPDSIDVSAMVAYNKSLKNQKPFAAVLNARSFLEEKASVLKINVSPGAELKTDNKDVKIKKSKSGWELSFDPSKIKKLNITVSRNKFDSKITFPNELWTQ